MPRKLRPQTPDGRYFVARGLLERCTDPSLDPSIRRAGIKGLMQARRAVINAGEDTVALAAALTVVDAAKRHLGERGPVWWTDGAPDEAGADPAASTYAGWWASLDEAARADGA